MTGFAFNTAQRNTDTTDAAQPVAQARNERKKPSKEV